jgi:hypothetical protein
MGNQAALIFNGNGNVVLVLRYVNGAQLSPKVQHGASNVLRVHIDDVENTINTGPSP